MVDSSSTTSAPEQLSLDRAWRQWAAQALAKGCSRDEILAALQEEGVPEPLAQREVATIAEAIAPLAERLHRAELILRIFEQSAPPYVTRRPLCDAVTFYEHYFTSSRPVVFSDGCRHTAAYGWTFEGLKQRLGSTVIEIGYPDPQSMPLGEAIDKMLDPATPPDFYLQSHNRALAGPLSSLSADLAPLPSFLRPTDAPKTANLWMGPAGTCSPLHHDTTSVYFCQLEGRKRYELVAPWDRAALSAPIVAGYDSALDLENPGEARVHRVVLSPGESLFIPVGWWHQVTSLDPAISVSVRSFEWPCDFSWYRPGHGLSPPPPKPDSQ